MFYLIVFLIIVTFALVDVVSTNKRIKTILLILTALALALIAGLRVETGGDWDNYAGIYATNPDLLQIIHSPEILLSQNIEIGYVLFSAILKSVGAPLQVLFFIISCFNIALLTFALRKYTSYPILGLLCYYCILYFSFEMIYIRQATAVIICFFALRYIYDKKPLPFILLVLLAASFQRSAIILLPFYWLLNRDWHFAVYAVTLVLGMFIMLFDVRWFQGLFIRICEFIGGSVYEKALIYTEPDSLFSVSRTIGFGFFLNALLLLAILFFKDQFNRIPYGTIHVNMFSLSVFSYYYFSELIELSNRLRLFFLISLIVLLPNIIALIKNNFIKAIAFCCIIVYCFSFSMHIFLEHPRAMAYNPYQNYVVMKLTHKQSTGLERLEQSKQAFREDRKR